MTCFTAEQQQFIQHQNGNAVCIAGAGTGKTTTLVGLIKQKLETVAPENIMVLMFNKDIRTDFKAKLVESGVQHAVPVHTFHSFCLKFLNHTGYLRETGFTAEFNQGEQDKRFVTQILRSIAGGEKSYQRQQLIKDPKTIELVMNFIGLVKAYMLPANEVFALTDISEEYRFIISAYHDFEVVRKQHKVLFFDDWLVETVKVLKQSPEIQAYYQQQCQLLIVDEFQDINNAQYALLKALLGDNSQLIAVGDVDQCIYKWRGSAPQFMLNFEQDFKPATTYTLSKTFRFGHSLALAAGHLIANNNERFHDFVTISNEDQSDTQVAVTGSGRQVGEIAQAIQTHLNNGVAPSDIAILVRRWSQALLFELAFLSKQIPFQMPIPSVLSHCHEVRLLMELMGFVTGRFRDYPQQYKSNVLFNLMSFPHCYIPNKLLQPFCNELAALPVSQWRSHAVKLEKIHESVKFDSFIDRVELLAQLEPKGSFKAVEVYRQYRKQSFLDNWIWKTEATSTEIEEALERLDSIETVLETMDQPCEKALQYFEYYSNQSQQHQQTSKSDSVQLTTIFRAKGCEYQHVFLPYWDKDAFPYVNRAASSIAADTEEERRLAYVAITRAKQSAHIFYTTEHNKESLRQCASQFVLEAKTNIAAEAGSALYQEGELPYFRSTLLEQYYDKLGRLEDMVKPELPKVVEKSFSSEGYSYGWALTQPLPANAEKVIRSMVKTKTRKYLDGELTRILRELANASETKKKVLENRLIVVARAKERK